MNMDDDRIRDIEARANRSRLPPVAAKEPEHARPFSEWHEDYHDVLWWHFPIMEPPYVGSPLNDDWPFTDLAELNLGWTRFVVPAPPVAAKEPEPQ